jgi:hypothetical protein
MSQNHVFPKRQPNTDRTPAPLLCGGSKKSGLLYSRKERTNLE